MNRSYRATGIVLRQVDWGEADKLLTLYTRYRGKVRLVAKGIRWLNSRKGGSLELFNLVDVMVARGKNLGIVTEVEVLENYNQWRKDLIKVAVAYYFCELVDRLTPEEQTNEKVFTLLRDNLRLISGGKVKELVRHFEEELLDELGFGVPVEVRAVSGSLRSYIETIIERRINSPKILEGLF
ncbi:MAG: DNA repair protein RecO [Candidatus Shapirobacteria bacterium]